MPVPELPPSAASNGVALFEPVGIDGPSPTPGLARHPNPAFFLVHHPKSWEVESEGLKAPTFLPVFAPFALLPGAGGVRTRDRGEAKSESYRRAVGDRRDRGEIFIDPNKPLAADHRPAGTPEGGYLRAAPCRDPKTGTEGLFHDEVWNVPLQGGGARFDRASYNRWRAWLVESGAVPPCSDGVKAQMRRRFEARVEQAEVAPLPEEVRKRRLKEHQARLDVVTKAEKSSAEAVA
jgi:hypothetical protein